MKLVLALKGGYELETILFYPELFSETQLNNLTTQQLNIIEISKEVYEKLAHRETTEGVLAVAKTKEHALDNLKYQLQKIR